MDVSLDHFVIAFLADHKNLLQQFHIGRDLDAVISDGLLPLLTVSGKIVIDKAITVTMVVKDNDALSWGKSSKGFLCTDSIIGGNSIHWKYMLKTVKIVYEDDSGGIALNCEFLFHLSNEKYMQRLK